MPITKQNNTVSITSLITPIEQEQKIANSILKSKIELKDTSLSRMTSVKSEITYYGQKVNGGNDFLANTANIGTLDPNLIQFNKITGLIIVCQGEISSNSSTEDVGKTIAEEGTFKTLPNTIKPLPNDHFVMFVAGKKNLYRVSEVNKATVEDDAAYECQFMLVDTDDAEGKLSIVEKNVVETYVFKYSHVGTQFRTIYRNDEYKYLSILGSMYNTIGQFYNDEYYDKSINTYILNYTVIDAGIKDKPYIIAGEQNSIPVRIEENAKWYGSYMFDRHLIEFITKNNIFQYVNKKIIYPTRFVQDIKRMYVGTIFYGVERQDYKTIKYTHFVPMSINYNTPSTLPHLYGKVDLVPTLDVIPGVISLFPPSFIQRIRTSPSIKNVKDITITTTDSIMDLMVEIISCFVNKVNINYSQYLELLNNNLSQLLTENTHSEYAFYIYPLIAYIIQVTMSSMSSKEYSIYQ